MVGSQLLLAYVCSDIQLLSFAKTTLTRTIYLRLNYELCLTKAYFKKAFELQNIWSGINAKQWVVFYLFTESKHHFLEFSIPQSHTDSDRQGTHRSMNTVTLFRQRWNLKKTNLLTVNHIIFNLKKRILGGGEKICRLKIDNPDLDLVSGNI